MVHCLCYYYEHALQEGKLATDLDAALAHL